MVASFTPNVQLTEPARGDDIGTWDTPVNGNTTLLDLLIGGIATISLNNSNVILSAAQFQCRNITFNSTLTGSVTITFPTSFTKAYEIQHLCTGSSAFTITLETTAGGQVISVPPGVTVDCFNDGSNIKFKNLWGPVASYYDVAGSSVPNWVSGCTVPPLLDCNGSTFSSGTYPQLAIALGGTTLPDFRGRAPYFYNEGTTNISSNGAGIPGSTLFGTGGNNGVTLASGNIPTLSGSNSITVTPTGQNQVVACTDVGISQISAPNTGTVPVPAITGANWAGVTNFAGTNTITVNTNASPTAVGNAAPGIVSGLRLIRAA